MDPLLNYKTILPATKPVGISNDLIFAEPNSPFMDSVIHNLIAFDHYYLSDYPTVMFSSECVLSAGITVFNSSLLIVHPFFLLFPATLSPSVGHRANSTQLVPCSSPPSYRYGTPDLPMQM